MQCAGLVQLTVNELLSEYQQSVGYQAFLLADDKLFNLLESKNSERRFSQVIMKQSYAFS